MPINANNVDARSSVFNNAATMIIYNYNIYYNTQAGKSIVYSSSRDIDHIAESPFTKYTLLVNTLLIFLILLILVYFVFYLRST